MSNHIFILLGLITTVFLIVYGIFLFMNIFLYDDDLYDPYILNMWHVWVLNIHCLAINLSKDNNCFMSVMTSLVPTFLYSQISVNLTIPAQGVTATLTALSWWCTWVYWGLSLCLASTSTWGSLPWEGTRKPLGSSWDDLPWMMICDGWGLMWPLAPATSSKQCWDSTNSFESGSL